VSLPEICHRLGVVHFRVSGTIHTRRPTHEKLRALISLWPEILAAWKAQQGCRWSIRCRDTGPGYRLVSLDR
jgi:hypothetical protein